MAHAERPTYTQDVPPNATVRTEKGERYACWPGRGGKPVKALILPDGRCRRTVPGKWIGRYRDHEGRKCQTEPFGERNAALAEAIKLEGQGRAVAEGREPVKRVKAHTQLIDLMPAYVTYLTGVKKTGEKRVKEVERILTTVIGTHGLTTPGSVDCEKLDHGLEVARQAGKSKEIKGGTPAEEYSYRTRNLWVATLRAFGKWMVRKAKAASFNPFEGLETVNDEPHRTRYRRIIPVAELELLIDTTLESNECVIGLCGYDRAVLYLIASHTGLRAGALLKLTPEAFTWHDGEPVAVNSSDRMQKNKTALGISLIPAIRPIVRDWLKGKTPGEPVFDAHVTRRTADMIRHDLAAARAVWVADGKNHAERKAREASGVLLYQDATGQVFDFHAMRVQAGVMLAAGGVSLAAAQQILDHSDPKLTAAIYSKFGGELGKEMAKMTTLPRLTAAANLGANLGAEVERTREKSMSKVTGRTPSKKKKAEG